MCSVERLNGGILIKEKEEELEEKKTLLGIATFQSNHFLGLTFSGSNHLCLIVLSYKSNVQCAVFKSFSRLNRNIN